MENELRSKIDESFDLIRQLPLIEMRAIDRSKKTIKDLKVKSSFRFRGTVYLVTDKYFYYEKKKDVIDCVEFQITNVLTGEVKYLEYSEDDTVEIYITTGKISTKEIGESLPHYDYDFLKNEVKDFTLTIGRSHTDFYYDDNWKSRFVRDGQYLADSELVRMIEFESDDEQSFVTFEYWEDDSMEVFSSKQINSYELEILSI